MKRCVPILRSIRRERCRLSSGLPRFGPRKEPNQRQIEIPTITLPKLRAAFVGRKIADMATDTFMATKVNAIEKIATPSADSSPQADFET